MATTGEDISKYATTFVGLIPYHLGASMTNTAKLTAADCSSFVKFIYSGFGIVLPRRADQQYKATKQYQVDLTKLKPGDLVFFGGYNTPDNPAGYAGIQHVGIYIGNGKILDEGGANPNNVGITALKNYGDHVIAATRPTGLESGEAPGGSSTSGGISGGGVSGTVTEVFASATEAVKPYFGMTYGDLKKNPDVGDIFTEVQAQLGKSDTDIFGANPGSWDQDILLAATLYAKKFPDRIAKDPLGGITDIFGALVGFLGKLTNPANWLHAGAMVVGVGLVGFGIYLVAKDANETGPGGLVSPMPIILKEGS